MSSKVKLLATGTVSIHYGWIKKIELMKIYELKLQPRGQPPGLQPPGATYGGNLRGQPPKHFVKPKSLVYFATSNYTN